MYPLLTASMAFLPLLWNKTSSPVKKDFHFTSINQGSNVSCINLLASYKRYLARDVQPPFLLDNHNLK